MSNAISTYKNSLATSFDSYLHQAYLAPVLSADEEHELACRFYHNADKEAAHKLVFSHIKFVAKIARNYHTVGLPLSDLIQEGSVGLMKAVRNFNPYHGVRLASFSLHWIKAEIHEFILKNWSLVKIATTKAQRKIFFNLHKFNKQTKYFSNDDIQQIADFLKVKVSEVNGMVQRLSHRGDFHTEESEVAEILLEDQNSNHANELEQHNWQTHQNNALLKAIYALDERSQIIIKSRWLDQENKISLKELAERLNVSIVRISQLEKQALKSLKKLLTQDKLQ